MLQDKLVNILKTTGPNITIRSFWTFWEIPITKKGNMIKIPVGAKKRPLSYIVLSYEMTTSSYKILFVI